MPISSSSHVGDFTLKHILRFETCASATCEKFAYKHSEKRHRQMTREIRVVLSFEHKHVNPFQSGIYEKPFKYL